MKSNRVTGLVSGAGFTLVELLVSVSIISLIMVVLVGMTNQISKAWTSTTGKIQQFQEARDGFESMTRKVSQATLNAYWDIVTIPVGGIDTPKDFVRASQLRFVSGPMSKLAPDATRPTHGVFFQAPLGFVDDTSTYGKMDNLLNTWGYFLEVKEDQNIPNFLNGHVPAKTRSRLMELMEPAESLSVYDLDAKGSTTAVAGNQLRWFQTSLALSPATRPVRALAENVIAMVIWPKLSKRDEDTRRDSGMSVLSPNYLYDSSVLTFRSANLGNAALPIYLNDGASLKTSSDIQEAGGISPKNQLPPIVQVTMVALDEPSAARLVAKNGSNATVNLVNGLFTTACSKGTSSTAKAQYDIDLAALETNLQTQQLSYRIFTADVSIRGARWSALQSK